MQGELTFDTYWASDPVALIDCHNTGLPMVTVTLNHGSVICPVIQAHDRAFAIVPRAELHKHGLTETELQSL